GSANAKDLFKWKSLRIIRFRGDIYAEELVKALPSLPHLEEINRIHLNASSATDVFKFAAASPSLQHLYITTSNVPNARWRITTSMAQDLVHWSTARPVRVFGMEKFSWKHDADRQTVLTSVLANPALESFYFLEYHHGTLFKFEAKYNKSHDELCLGFFFSFPMDPGCNVDYVSSYIHFFHQLIEKRVKTLTLRSIESVGFETARAILKPILENSKVEELKIDDCDLTMARMNQVIDAICNVSTLRSLFIGHDVCCKRLTALIHGAPASMRRIALQQDINFRNKQWKALRATAEERLIRLISNCKLMPLRNRSLSMAVEE
ncbi:unnamed protein product, partial [Aphanomyces euteiches]